MEFPPLLREIPKPPKNIFVSGALPDFEENKFLCVVGSRKYTEYGKSACQKLIAGLRGFPIVIVSGLAIGIDSIAHQAALDAGLKTIAVPGSGLNPTILYPQSHLNLAKNILRNGGALLSEFESDFKATPWSFPQRNRIMAGLSHAVLIVEAEQKSGTLITSRLATDYNRDVLTVPGSIFSKNSDGPNMLLRLGATPISSSEDILTALGFESRTERPDQEMLFLNCSTEERKLLAVIGEPKEKSVIMRELQIPINELNALISLLEIKGLIKEYLGEIHKL